MLRKSNRKRVTISLPSEQFESVESIRNTSNRSKFISELIGAQLQILKGGSTS